ncbi:MAG: sugar-binding protein [Sedimentisphaerales bacterium]|nr:sugar-binding protein [Sedimentisphaerales bacterium]
MFRKLIFVLSLIFALSLVGRVPAQDVVIPSPGSMPKLDGNIDEVWYFSTEQAIDTSQVGSAPSSPADGSGTWRALWNWENLYVLVQVNDDALTNDSGGGDNKWNDDSVEIYVDGDNSKDSSVGANDHQYTFRWNNEELEEPSAIHNGAPSLVGVEYAVVTTDVGYLLEVKLPWMSIMGEAATPGQEIGFDVWINDDDDGTDRDSQISWYSTDGNGWQDPSVWATAVLEASEKAANPTPADGTIHGETWVSLGWLGAPAAVSHDVYFGENPADVEAGTGDTFQGNQTATFLVFGFPGFAFPEGLIPGTTYYWKIDEVSADGTKKTGDLWSFIVPPKSAYGPNPADNGKFVPRNVTLSWTPGDDAKLHTVYFGDDFDSVSSATGGTQIGVTTYTPGTLEYEKTYYWRVDEYDGITEYTGDVWSFKTAKNGGGVRAEYFGDEQLNNSVLTRIDPQINFNWGDPGSPDPAIGEDSFSVRWTGEVEAGYTETYTFYPKTDDGVRLWVGGKQLVDSWETVPLYPKEHSGTINFIEGSTYRIVMEYFESSANAIAELRWESPSTPKQLIPQAAFSLPIKAGNPNPSNGGADVKHTPMLTWVAGNDAVSHEVYFGTDEEAVKNATKASPEHKGTKALGDESHDPGQLEWNTTYYWRVDEVEDGGTIQTGNIWCFTTANFLIIDDFESYNDINEGEPGSNRIYLAWLDGFDNPAVNGSVVGNANPPLAEQTIVHSGNQSMPMSYDNAVGKSEATLTLASNRDWTVKGVDTLAIWYIGDTANVPETMYVALNDSAVVTNDNPDAALATSWTEWLIPLQTFADQGVNLANVTSITLGFGNRNNPIAGGVGIMYIDDIRLYAPTP